MCSLPLLSPAFETKREGESQGCQEEVEAREEGEKESKMSSLAWLLLHKDESYFNSVYIT